MKALQGCVGVSRSPAQKSFATQVFGFWEWQRGAAAVWCDHQPLLVPPE